SRTWQMLLKGIPEVREANRPVSAGEMVLIRIAHAANLPTLDEALRSIDNGDARPTAVPSQPVRPSSPPLGAASAPPGGGGSASAVSEPRVLERGGSGQTMRLVEVVPQTARPALQPVSVSQPAVEAVPVKSLADVAALADTHRAMTFKVLLKRCVRLVRL